jgi:hypothetical protein
MLDCAGLSGRPVKDTQQQKQQQQLSRRTVQNRYISRITICVMMLRFSMIPFTVVCEFLLFLLLSGAVSSASADSTTAAIGEINCANVTGATATEIGDLTWGFSVSVRSQEAGLDKYANEWQIQSSLSLPSSSSSFREIWGTRVLGHPHEMEQPFTSSLSGVQIPESVDTVIIAAKDSVLGYCGAEFVLVLRDEPCETCITSPSSSVIAPADIIIPTVEEEDDDDDASSGGAASLHCLMPSLLLLLGIALTMMLSLLPKSYTRT